MRNLDSMVAGLLIASSFLLFFLGGYSLRWGRYRGAKSFLLLCLTASIYSAGYALELMSPDLEGALFWNRFQYLGVPFLAPLWVLLARFNSRKSPNLSVFSWMLLFAIPVLTIIIRYVPSLEHLHYASVRFLQQGVFSVLVIEKGPWYLIAAGHMTCLTLYGAGIYLGAVRSGRTRKISFILMVIASMLPLISLWLNAAEIVTWGLDTGPLMMVLSSTLLFILLFRYRLMDVVPLAHEKVFERSRDAILIVGNRGDLLDFNLAAVTVFQELTQKHMGRGLETVLSNHEEFVRCVRERRDAQITIIRPGGECAHYQVRVTSFTGDLGENLGMMISLTDITEHVNALKRMETEATIDSLTGVANRKHVLISIFEEMNRMTASGKPFSLLMIDVDHFKEVNDAYGHHAGDAALQQVIAVCLRSARVNDIIGRYGGEEFVFGLPGAPLSDAVKVAERMRVAVSDEPISCDGRKIHITVSIGAAASSESAPLSGKALLKLADQALYLAKQRGRNRVETRLLEQEHDLG